MLSWSRRSNATAYHLEVAADDLFQQLLLEERLTDTSFTFTEPLATGTFFWRVTASNACGGATSAASSFTVQTTTATREPLNWEVTHFPNPARDQVFLEFTGDPPSSLQLEIFNSEGQQLANQKHRYPLTNLQIDLSDYPPGIYFLRLRSKDAAIIRRIIRQR